MNWQEICDHKALQDLPFRIELNKWGQIVMSPVKVKHSFFQGRIQSLLEERLKIGTVMPELAMQTTDGVKVADVVWVSDQRLDVIEEETVASIAPEICIEVKSASNTLEEMLVKKDLYLGAGAIEVWLCDKSGAMSFYNQQGQLDASLLVPDFPKLIQRAA